jgi:hypothetical protein
MANDDHGGKQCKWKLLFEREWETNWEFTCLLTSIVVINSYYLNVRHLFKSGSHCPVYVKNVFTCQKKFISILIFKSGIIQ